MKEKQINYNNSTVHYQTTGKGLPVMLVHGFGEDSSVWNKQVEFLKNDYQLIIPDIPGSGRSKLLEKENVGMEDYAECLQQILSAEKIDRCIMIGHSMGGYITLAFAEKHPGSLICFGLFHSSAYADDDIKKETRRKAIAFMETNGAEAFLRTSIPGLFYDQGNSGTVDTLLGSGIRPLQVARHLDSGQATIVARPLYGGLLEKAKAFSAKALIQYYRAMIARPDRTNILKEAVAPVLFIAGEHDKAVPFKHSLEQSHMPGRSYIYVLRESAHMGMWEEVEIANGSLFAFLRDQKTI